MAINVGYEFRDRGTDADLGQVSLNSGRLLD